MLIIMFLICSQSCKPKFYAGHFEEDFDIKESSKVENSLDGYLKFLEENDDELPKKFYNRRKSS